MLKRGWLLLLLLSTLSAAPFEWISPESDPDAFVQNRVNLIDGDYSPAVSDLTIAGPDALVLHRFYSSKIGGWRIFPERFLVLGKSSEKGVMGWCGERSGAILPYLARSFEEPLKVDLSSAVGVVNTYAGEISGQTNPYNNQIKWKECECDLTLGDGTHRIYKKVEGLPSLLLGEELTPLMVAQVIDPSYFLLIEEQLPSGNRLFFSYDKEGHLISVEMKNRSLEKSLSWIHFDYEPNRVAITTSDHRTLHYLFEGGELVLVEGSHSIPVSYDYRGGLLVRESLPEGRFVEIDYCDRRVSALKGPNPSSGQSEALYSFAYEEGATTLRNGMGVKKRYLYDKALRLTAIEHYDDQEALYRVDRKFWEGSHLIARSIEDGGRRCCSHRSFGYDSFGNVVEEQLCGTLTGKQEVLLYPYEGRLLHPPTEECSVKRFGYSSDGLNLLTRLGDCKGNQTLYTYAPGTHLLTKKFIYDGQTIKKRTFHTYNEDALCIRTVEDDGSGEEEFDLQGVTERHIREIKPNGMVEERGLDLTTGEELLIKRWINTYDDQSNLLSSATYDANGDYAFTESRAYSSIGQVVKEVDRTGGETLYGYDRVGNRTSISDGKSSILIRYDLRNRPIELVEGQFKESTLYDLLDRKICSIDRFGRATQYEYDPFNRLTKVVYPEVLNEKEEKISPTFKYSYDLFGHLLTAEDPKGFITESRCNLRGDPTQIAYPDGTFELFKYDPEGAVHRSLSRDRVITVHEYDYLGRPVHEEESTMLLGGGTRFLISTQRQWNGFRPHYEKRGLLRKESAKYDHAGRPISLLKGFMTQDESNPNSRWEEIRYNPLGYVGQKRVWFTDDEYALESFEYDLYGKVIEKRVEDGHGSILSRRAFSYEEGRVDEYSFEGESKIPLLTTFYNSQGEPTLYLDGAGNETRVIIDTSHQNSLGQLVLKKTVVNPIGVQTEVEFDALNRPYSIVKRDSWGSLLSSQKILYDALGCKAVEICDRVVDGKILDSQRTEWIYGPMGRVEELIEAAGSPDERRTFYGYGCLGKVVSKRVVGGKEPILFKYYNDGLLYSVAVGDQILNKYQYDEQNNVKRVEFNGGSVVRQHNAFGQVIEEAIDYEGELSTLHYAYDRKGRLTGVALPDGSKIIYLYDALFGREVLRISSTGELLYRHTYDEYDGQGRLLKESGITGSSGYEYDLNGEKIAQSNDFFSESYRRDPLGRLIEVSGERKARYSYDSLSHLTLEEHREESLSLIGLIAGGMGYFSPDMTKSYAYDSLDNRIASDGQELAHNGLNQLTRSAQADFSYDLYGNLLAKRVEGEESRFEHNPLSQLVSMEKPDGTTLTFFYDPFGRLLIEDHLDRDGRRLSRSRYLYLGHQEIGTLAEDGSIQTLKVPSLSGLTSIAFEIDGKVYGPIHDVTGNVVALVDPATEEIVERYSYTAFGEETIYNQLGAKEERSPIGNPWRFVEKRLDEESGLVLFGFRLYDPSVGRWTAADPAGRIDGPNLYVYLHNDPLNAFDPFGLASIPTSAEPFFHYFYGNVEKKCFCETHRTCKRGGELWRSDSLVLPKIGHCDFFEAGAPPHRRSRIADLGLPEPPGELKIVYTNGINTSFEEAVENAHYLSRLAGGYNVHIVYNATHGWLADLVECVMGRCHVATEPVRLLHELWNRLFDGHSEKARILTIGHSQGGLNLRNALLDYSPERRRRISALGVASPAYTYQKTCGRVIHLRASAFRDPIPRFDPQGAKRARGTIVDLKSHPDAPLHDHGLQSPTFEQKIIEFFDIHLNL